MALIIDESNYADQIDIRLAKYASTDDADTRGCLPRKTAYGSIPFVYRATDYVDPIPRSEWPTMIESGKGTWLSDLTRDHLPPHDQGKTNYCWAHSSVRPLEVLRVWANQKPILFSAESVAVPITGGVNRGGSLDEALNWIRSHGTAPQKYWPPNDRNEKHAADGWQQAALLNRYLRWTDVATFDMQMTLALLRIPIAIGLAWWGHAVCQLDPVQLEDETFGILIDNPWGPDWGDNGLGILTERRGTADLGAFAPLTTSLPDPMDDSLQMALPFAVAP